MRGINKVFILGRLGKDVLLQQTKNGRCFVGIMDCHQSFYSKMELDCRRLDWHAVRFGKTS